MEDISKRPANAIYYTTFTVRVPKVWVHKFYAYAKARNRSMTGQIREMIVSALKKDEETTILNDKTAYNEDL